jgi:hypothetical protein
MSCSITTTFRRKIRYISQNWVGCCVIWIIQYSTCLQCHLALLESNTQAVSAYIDSRRSWDNLDVYFLKWCVTKTASIYLKVWLLFSLDWNRSIYYCVWVQYNPRNTLLPNAKFTILWKTRVIPIVYRAVCLNSSCSTPNKTLNSQIRSVCTRILSPWTYCTVWWGCYCFCRSPNYIRETVLHHLGLT